MERKNTLKFEGTGAALFGLTIINTILTFITLGLYYPWAKVKYLKYYYQNTYLAGDYFSFHGTGGELFKGFIKAVLIMLAGYAIAFLLIYGKIPLIGPLLLFALFVFIVPAAIHGTYRYRLAKTSWRSIFFGYRGNLTALIKLFWKGVALSVITLGIYGFWFEMNFRKYIYRHIRFGDVKLDFTGEGLDYFLLSLKGIILTILTFGIYSFWFTADLFNFVCKNTKIEQNGNTYDVSSNATAGKIFNLYFINILIIIFTLGLGFAWAMVREMKFLTENIIIPEELDVDNIVQTETDYQDASGDSMFDFLDLDFTF